MPYSLIRRELANSDMKHLGKAVLKCVEDPLNSQLRSIAINVIVHPSPEAVHAFHYPRSLNVNTRIGEMHQQLRWQNICILDISRLIRQSAGKVCVKSVNDLVLPPCPAGSQFSTSHCGIFIRKIKLVNYVCVCRIDRQQTIVRPIHFSVKFCPSHLIETVIASFGYFRP